MFPYYIYIKTTLIPACRPTWPVRWICPLHPSEPPSQNLIFFPCPDRLFLVLQHRTADHLHDLLHRSHQTLVQRAVQKLQLRHYDCFSFAIQQQRENSETANYPRSLNSLPFASEERQQETTDCHLLHRRNANVTVHLILQSKSHNANY